MNSKEFANGLFKLAEQHKNDNRTIFDTDWTIICTEAANYILELQRQLDDITHSNESWCEWYENRKKEEEAVKERDILNIVPCQKEIPEDMGPEIPLGVFE